MNKLIMRIVSGILVSSLLVISLLLKGIWLKLLVLFFSFLGFYEYLRCFKDNKGYNINMFSSFAIVISVALKYIIFPNINETYSYYFNVLLIVTLMYYFYDYFIRKFTVIDFLITAFGVIYVVTPIFILYNLYSTEYSNYVWIIMIISIFTDIFAFVFGKLFGKHKLIEEISPNKTIEGAIGAVFGSFIAILIYYFVFSQKDVELLKLIFLSIFGSIFAQIGDIFASKLKRFCDIKDFGNIIPGHGGVLDRLDSIIFVTFIVCILA